MLKNYNYILTIILYPFILVLSYLILDNYLHSSFYLYLDLLMIIVFIPSFIMSLYNALEEILSSKKKWRVILLILFSYFYLPIYYTKYISKSEKYLGSIITILGIVLSYYTFSKFNDRLFEFLTNAFKNNVIINENYIYISADKKFTMNVSKDFRCNRNDIGDYVIYCDRLDDDSFIGVYSYEINDYNEEDILDILNFHINQSEEYIKESGYISDLEKKDDILEINYNNMVILLTQRIYVANDNQYSLVIIKEMPKELEDIQEFQKMIETIYFLNYNGIESS